MKKNNRPEHLPASINEKWAECPAFSKEVLERIKAQLGKIGQNSFRPLASELFNNFSVNPDKVKLVIVNEKWPFQRHEKESMSLALSTIWQKLEEVYGWDNTSNYLDEQLLDWKSQDVLILSTSLTNVKGEIWEEFMIKLFKYLNEGGRVFCFMDSPSFDYSQYCKGNSIYYGFHPKEITEEMNKDGGHFLFGLPF